MQKRVITIFLLFVFSFIVLLCGIWFTNVKTIFSMMILTVMIVVLSFLYSSFTKAMTLPEGYTLFQALMFFRSCVKIGVNSLEDVTENYELLQRLSQEKDITVDLDEGALWKLYCDGREINSFIPFQNNNNNNNQESEDCDE